MPATSFAAASRSNQRASSASRAREHRVGLGRRRIVGHGEPRERVVVAAGVGERLRRDADDVGPHGRRRRADRERSSSARPRSRLTTAFEARDPRAEARPLRRPEAKPEGPLERGTGGDEIAVLARELAGAEHLVGARLDVERLGRRREQRARLGSAARARAATPHGRATVAGNASNAGHSAGDARVERRRLVVPAGRARERRRARRAPRSAGRRYRVGERDERVTRPRPTADARGAPPRDRAGRRAHSGRAARARARAGTPVSASGARPSRSDAKPIITSARGASAKSGARAARDRMRDGVERRHLAHERPEVRHVAAR
jgi:hypothetical protein